MRFARLSVFVLLAAASAHAQEPPGLGFAFAPRPDGLLVQVLAEDGPAVGSGLREGDVVTAISGKRVAGLDQGALAEWLRAVGGSSLPSVLDVTRGSTTLQVEITPAPYSRAALAALVEARSQRGLDGTSPETALALFDGAMNQPPTYRRASREGPDLVIASSICTVRIPVTSATAVEPSETSETYFSIAAGNIRVKCSGDPYTNEKVNFDLQTREMRDRAVETARAVVRTWAAGEAIAPPATPSTSGPRPTESRPSTPTAQTPPTTDGKRCISGTCTDGIGTAEYWRDGALVLTYTGPFANGAPEGQGSYTTATGNVYRGGLSGGYETRGTITYTDGDTYTGEWANGQFNGQGLYTFGPGDYEGDTLEGRWADDLPVTGTYTWASGQTYTGDWDGWERTGRGTIRYTSGNTYEGDWVKGQRHGRGTFTFTNGLTFVGDWVDDARVRGRESYDNGNTYEGKYADDQRHGQGTMTYADGSVYVGAWQAGEKHGQGRYTWGSGDYKGDVYEGEYREGERTGRGTYTWSSGMVYTGDWINGSRNGQGVMTWTSGQRYDGAWTDGKRVGQGTQRYSDGRVFVGTWAEDAPVEGTLQQVGAQPRPVRVENGQFIYTDQ